MRYEMVWIQLENPWRRKRQETEEQRKSRQNRGQGSFRGTGDFLSPGLKNNGERKNKTPFRRQQSPSGKGRNGQKNGQGSSAKDSFNEWERVTEILDISCGEDGTITIVAEGQAGLDKGSLEFYKCRISVDDYQVKGNSDEIKATF